MTFIPCAFVNSENPPVKQIHHDGYNVTQDGDELVLWGFYDVYYPHPQTPENATLQVLERRELLRIQSNDSRYPALFLLLNAQKNVDAFKLHPKPTE